MLMLCHQLGLGLGSNVCDWKLYSNSKIDFIVKNKFIVHNIDADLPY